MTPTELYAVGEVRLDKLDDNVAYSITNPENSDEVFLLEYRTQQTWDQGHKNSGILLWHIDYVQSVWTGKTINQDVNHMHVDIEEAVPNTGTYSLAEVVGSAEVLSIIMSNVASSPVVVELPFPPNIPPPLFPPLGPLLISPYGSSDMQPVITLMNAASTE